MNWTILLKIFQLVPYALAGIEQIHAGASTETKSQIAQQVLQTAVAAAQSVSGTANQATEAAVGSAVSAGISAVTGQS